MEENKIIQFPNKTRIDTDPKGSDQNGFAGIFERLLRRFKFAAHIGTLIPMYVLASLCIGTALIPGISLFKFLSAKTSELPSIIHLGAQGFSIAAGFFLYGFSMVYLIPAVNYLLRAKLKPWRGPYYSFAALPWSVHNGLTYLMRYTFLDFITPSPFNHIFYKLMGMKMGQGTQINTSNISDPSLVELGARVTIGGSVTICGHYGMSGFLILAPVKIGDDAVVGLRAIVMGGAEIGAGAKVLPNSVVMPKTIIPAGEIWGGVPAAKINDSTLDTLRKQK